MIGSRLSTAISLLEAIGDAGFGGLGPRLIAAIAPVSLAQGLFLQFQRGG